MSLAIVTGGSRGIGAAIAEKLAKDGHDVVINCASSVEKAEADMQERFIQMFTNCVLSVNSAGNLIVLKTIAGSASAACEAVDSLKWPEILGTIAGDNTIFLAVHDVKAVPELVRKFQKMMK